MSGGCAPARTFLQYDYLMSHFVYRFWVLKTGPACLMGQQCMTFPFHLVCFGEEKSVIQNFLAEVLLIEVKMPSCAIYKIEAPSEKHLRVYIKAKHDDCVRDEDVHPTHKNHERKRGFYQKRGKEALHT